MGWYVSSQAFLMAAYAVASNAGHPHRAWVPLATALAGLGTTVIVGAALLAALGSIEVLRE